MTAYFTNTTNKCKFSIKFDTMRKIIVCIAMILAFVACKKNRPDLKNSPELMKYISAYTNGEVSKTDNLIIQFSKDAVEQSSVGKTIDDKLFQIDPSISGKTIWLDQKTVKFIPDNPLQSSQAYLVRFTMGKVFKELPKEAQVFSFDFKVKTQSVLISYDPPTYDGLEDKQMTIHGRIETNDFVSSADLKKCIEIQATNQKLVFDFEKSSNLEKAKEFNFVISHIQVTNKEESVKLKFDGKNINSKDKLDFPIKIASSDGFTYVDKRVKNFPDQAIRLFFNVPLDPNQDLNGLVSVENGLGIQGVEIESNVLSIYPASRVLGNFNIVLDAAMKSKNGVKLGSNKVVQVTFEDLSPAVRMSNNKMILPNAERLFFPFEAVNLNAVDVEIFKIFDNNILQYMQTDDNDDYNLTRVGRIIVQKKISLNELSSNSNQSWKKYSIDLSSIIKPEPNAIYQVRIGFKASYSTYNCDKSFVVKPKNYSDDGEAYYGLGAEFSDGEFKSFMNNYYGEEGYYEDYEWSDRDNPCKPGYYNSSRFKACTLFSSAIGLMAKSGNNGELMVIATDLNTTQALQNVDLDFYDFQLQKMQTLKTNSEGIGIANFTHKPFAVIASYNGQKSYLRLMDNESLNISQFDVVGQDVDKGLKAYLYGERGVWRPGDSLFLNFMLDTKARSGMPEDMPISFEFFNPKGVLEYSTVSSTHFNNLYPFYLATKPDAFTGNWKSVVKVGGSKFVFPIKIESIKANRLKMNLNFGKKELSGNDGVIQGILSANWLYGAPAKNLRAKIDCSIWQIKDNFPKFPNFKVYDVKNNQKFYPEVIFDGKLNEEGTAQIVKQLNSGKQLFSGPMTANFKVSVFEEGGESSQDNFSIKYHPFSDYAAVATPKNTYGQATFGIDQSIPFEVACINDQGIGLSGKNLEIKVFRVEWRWWWDESTDYQNSYEQSNTDNLITSKDVLTNSAGKSNFQFKTSNWGRYYIQVKDKSSGHICGDYFYCGYPESDDQFLSRRAASILPVTNDNEKYNVGDKIKLKFNCPEKARVLISLENGSRVVKTIWADAVKGDNEFSFLAEKSFAPNVYANVSIIQAFGQNNNDLPIRMYGIVPIKVEDKTTRLQPNIKMANELKPGTASSIEISEGTGKAMSYTIDIVDEGLLDLTRFKTPDPWSAFFAKEALGVKTWDLYDRLIGAGTADGSQILSIGGDAGKAPNPDKQKAIRFKPMVIHLGPFTLDKGKKATHKFNVPNYIGSVRAMVVATNGEAYGNAEKTVPVKAPLMVLGSIPRVIGLGETIKVPVNVFTTVSKVKNVSISIKDQNGLLNNISSNSQSLTFTNPDEKVVYFNLKASDKEGVSKIRIQANGNGEQAYQEVELQVRNSNPIQTSVVSGLVKAKSEQNFKIEPIGVEGSNKTILEVSTLPPFNLAKHINYLITYPNGCLEQTVSAAFAQIYLSKIVALTVKQKLDCENNVKAALNKLKMFANADGSFNYWPGGSTNQWASNYAGHFLIESKNAGYNLPSRMLENWLANAKNQARKWSPTQNELGFYTWESSYTHAYRLYLLALAGSPDRGAMNRIREMKTLDKQSAVFLAAAYALDGKTSYANQLINNTQLKYDPYQYSGYTFGSALRDKAILFHAYDLLKRKTESAALFVEICKDLNREDFAYNTQNLGFALSAIGKYFDGNNQLGQSLDFAYSINNGKEMNVKVKEAIFYIELPVSQKGVANIKLKNNVNNFLYTKIVKTGRPAAGNEKAESRNLLLSLKFVNLKGVEMDPKNIRRGEEFIVEVTLKNPGIHQYTYRNLALTQIFPPGWEITNNRMTSVQYAVSKGSIDYQDIRDDRVLSYFDLSYSSSVIIKTQITASYPGEYYLPGTQCEAMYDNDIYARIKGTWVNVL